MNNGLNTLPQPSTYFVLPIEPVAEINGDKAYHYFRTLSSQDENWSIWAHPTTLGPDWTIFCWYHDDDTFCYTDPMPYDMACDYHQNLIKHHPINA